MALTVRALRDGQSLKVPAAEIVPGDVVALVAGSLVPADCRLIDSKDLFVNEALLTGEPYPAEKNAGDVFQGQEQQAVSSANGVFMGSSVVSGTATAVVVATGRATRLGAIAGALRREPPPTAFALDIRETSTETRRRSKSKGLAHLAPAAGVIRAVATARGAR